MEILELKSVWFSLEHGNTGMQAILIQFWSKTDGRAAGRPGRVTGTFAKESILGICILKNFDIVYILEYLLFDILKKTRAKISWNWRDFRGEISHMRPLQARKLKLIEVSICGKLMATAAATASQQLCPSGKGPWPSRTGSKYPVQESLTSTNSKYSRNLQNQLSNPQRQRIYKQIEPKSHQHEKS